MFWQIQRCPYFSSNVEQEAEKTNLRSKVTSSALGSTLHYPLTGQVADKASSPYSFVGNLSSSDSFGISSLFLTTTCPDVETFVFLFFSRLKEFLQYEYVFWDILWSFSFFFLFWLRSGFIQIQREAHSTDKSAGHRRGRVQPRNLAWLAFIGWVISYANEWEGYSNYCGEGAEISRIWATAPSLVF